MSEFSDKKVVVTGGAQGIGKAVCARFLSEGALVSTWDSDREALGEVAEEWRAYADSFLPLTCDVSLPDQVSEAAIRVISSWSQVDVVINNAGTFHSLPIEMLEPDDWDRVLGVNLKSIYLTVRNLLPAMPQGASILNIASTRALQSEPHTEAYAASKGGVLALTHALAVSLSEKRIRVNALTPGWIEVSPGKKSSTRSPVGTGLREIDHHQHPARRVGTPEDIAEACFFLSSSRAGFITGTHLVIDGGMTIKMIYAG
ncbi:MAG TPA: SDR family oxidoreductase [Atribacteraceae bacterium]|nr:SDR family oxidoreductase [Atribacteraceae bacterium]